MALRPISAERALEQEWLRHIASISTSEALEELGSTKEGLDDQQVESSREAHGSNEVSKVKHTPAPIRFLKSFADPFTGILIGIAIVSLFTDVILVDPSSRDISTPAIILGMVLISGIMRFVQETKSGNAAEALAKTIETTCSVERKGHGRIEIPIHEVVVGDIIHLSAGDMIPADLRILSAKDLFVSQSALTGESQPIEKLSTAEKDTTESLTDFTDLAFLGSTVISGTALAVVASVGSSTLFGSIAGVLNSGPQKTSFDQGIESISRLLLKLMVAMVPVVFVINGLTKNDWLQALLFSLSIAVGLTPEMLPMIVTTCLAKGATDLSHKKVIVKRLDAIQNLGSIDVLCTDKTGTLTEDRVVLERHLNIDGDSDERVLRYAFMNSYFETGLRNLIDTAIIARSEEEIKNDTDDVDYLKDAAAGCQGTPENYEVATNLNIDSPNITLKQLCHEYHLVDELPFDFERRRVSVVIEDNAHDTLMITKGAIEEILNLCTTCEYGGQTMDLTQDLVEVVRKRAGSMADEGMRVLGVAKKANPSGVGELSSKDESDMCLIGYLAFLDPPKQSSADAIKALKAHGVTTKVLTGDSSRVAVHVCKAIGLDVNGVLDGAAIATMDDSELAKQALECTIFAKLSPSQKSRVVEALRGQGHVVGFMGDGVNDAPAMKVSDCGISVDTATDVAKESADIILLEKDLMVLEHGIVEGRKTYANMNKYIKMTASSNFGNIFSVLIASAFLPFMPMTAVQLLFLNFVYDITCTAIPWDNVDTEMLARPRTWDASSIASFMRWLGPTSSLMDITTFALLYFIICPMVTGAGWSALTDPAQRTLFVAVFQAGWFVESMITQTLVVHLIRTPKTPFIQSRASAPLTILGAAGIILACILPFTGFGHDLGFAPLPGIYFFWLLLIFIAYALLVSVVKKRYIKRFGHLL